MKALGMFVIFSTQVEDYQLDVESPQPGSAAAKIAPEPAKASIALNLKSNESTMERFGFEDGEDIQDVVVHMRLNSGEPMFANGEPIVGGCWALFHIPAINGNPTFLSAEITLPVPEFERVWNLFVSGGSLQPQVIASIGDVPFSSKQDKWLWNTKKEGSSKLLVKEMTIRFATKGLCMAC